MPPGNLARVFDGDRRMRSLREETLVVRIDHDADGEAVDDGGGEG